MVKIKINLKNIISLIFLTFLMGAPLAMQYNLVGNLDVDNKNRVSLPKTSTNHTPIAIDGNDDFTNNALIEGWEGSGMHDEPYIIENYIINASTVKGLSIRNTNLHFIINNVTVIDGGWNHNGFDFHNVTNGKLFNNTATSNQRGFSLDNSYNNTLVNNTATRNNYCFTLWDSSNNMLNNNTAANNDFGFSLGNSPNNTLSNNIAINNNYRGFALWDSSNNLLCNNSATNINGYGFSLDNSSSNRLSNNIAISNINGFFLSYSSNNNTLSNNIATNSSQNGFDLYQFSNNNILLNNIAPNNSRGFFLQESSNNTLNNNIAINNSDNNFHLVLSSNNNILVNNIASNSNFAGFFLLESSNNMLNNNTATNNYLSGFFFVNNCSNNMLNNNTATNNNTYGFFFNNYCSNNTLEKNLATQNSNDGFHFENFCNNNEMFNNVAINNSNDGFNIFYSSNNTFINNTATLNTYYGIDLYDANNNLISGNNLLDNGLGCISEVSSTGNIIANNTCFHLVSSTDNPDSDGAFWLNWPTEPSALEYTIFQNSLPLIEGLTNNSYYISGLPNGIYDYYIKASNDWISISDVIKITILLVPFPFTLNSTAGDPDLDGAFWLNWTISEHALNYSLYLDGLLLIAGLTNNSYFISGLTLGSYDFHVVAFNDHGNTSSNMITIEVDFKPQPFSLSSTASDPDLDGAFWLNWTTSVLAMNYSIYLNGDLLIERLINNSYYISGLLNGSYQYHVVAFNYYGNISSNVITIGVDFKPQPFSLSSTAGDPDLDGAFWLNWTTSELAMNYSIYLNGDLLIEGLNNNSYYISELSSGSYQYHVVAFNDHGNFTSNVIIIVVRIDVPNGNIPGYEVALLIGIIALVSTVFIKRKYSSGKKKIESL